MGKIGTAWVEVDGDLSPLNRKIEELKRRDAKVEVEADVDRASFARAKAAQKDLWRDSNGMWRNAQGQFAKTRVEIDRTTTSTNNLGGSVGKTNRNFQFLRNTTGLLKWPALIAGAGQAAGALGAAGGGAAALTGALAPGVGLLTQYGTLLGTIGQVAAVKALSGLHDVSTVVGGINEKIDQQSADWKKLNPQAQRFAVTIDRLQAGPLARLQNRIQRPLFAGLNEGIQRARKNFPALDRVLTGTSRTLGDLAKKAGDFVGSKAFGRDFQKIGTTNNLVLERLGKSGINVAHVITDIMVAARPLTEWLSKMALGWTDNLRVQTQTAREGGKLTHFFEETRQVTERVTSVLGSMGRALWNIISLGKPLGDSILKSLDKSAADFADWTESAKGENAIAKYFKDIKPPLFEMGRLVRDVVKDFFELSDSESLTPLLRQLRTELLPVLVDTVKSTSEAFGPNLLRLITHVAEILGKLAGASGPLTLYVDLLDGAATVINKLLDAVPGLQSGVVTLLGFAGVLKALKFTAAITGISALTRGFQALTAAEGAAATVPIGTSIARNLSYSRVGTAVGLLGAKIGGSLAGIIGKVIPGALAAVGIGNVLTSAISQDVKGAAAKGGGLIAGAIAGGLAAGLPGALVGAGIGSILGGVIASLFHGASKITPLQEKLKVSAHKVAQAFKDEKEATHGLARSQDQVQAAHRKTRRTADNLTGAERALQRARDKYPANSHQVVQAEHRVRDAKDADRRATRQLSDAEKLHGVRLKLARETYVSTLRVQRDRIADIRLENRHLAHHAQVVLDGVHSDEDAARIQRKLNDATTDLNRALVQKDRTLQDAAQQVGPKYAATLRRVTDGTVKVTKGSTELLRKLDPLNSGLFQTGKTLKNPLGTNLDQTTKKVKKTGDAVDEPAKNWQKRTKQMSGNVVDLSDVTGQGLFTIGDNTNQILGSLGAKKLNFNIKKLAQKATAGLFAKGGFAGQIPGYSRTDDRLIGVRGGEAVLRPEDHVPVVDASLRATHGMGLQEMFRRTGAKSSGSTFAKGGIVGRVDELLWKVRDHFDHLHVGLTSPAAAVSLGKRLQGMRYEVSEQSHFGGVTPGAHVSGSEHYEDRALDVNDDLSPFASGGGEPGSLDKLYSMLKSGKLTGATAELARVLLQGPKGDLKRTGQSALDRAWKKAKAYIAEKSQATIGGVGDLPSTSGPIAAIAQKMVTQRWGASQWPPFLNLKVGESGPTWDPTITNPSSGAGGIPQALPPSKMGSPAWPPTHGKESSVAQLGWMLDYIGGTYGNPANAYSTWLGRSPHWYKEGGVVDLWGTGLAKLAGGGMLKPDGHGGEAGPGGPGSHGGSGHGHGPFLSGIIKPGKHHRKRLKKFLKKIHTEGLDPELAKKIHGAQIDVETFSDYADRADSLNTENAVGTPILGKFLGQNEIGWLGDELEALRTLRNLLIRGEDGIKVQRDLLAKQLKKAKDKLRTWQKRSDEIKHEQKSIGREIKDIHKELSGKHVSKHRRKHLNERLDKLGRKVGHLHDKEREADYSVRTLDQRIIPALKSQESKDKGKGSGLESSLIEVEGRIPDPLAHRRIKEFAKPYDFRFSGQIFDTMMQLKDLRGSLKPPAPDTSDLTDLLRQQLLDSQHKFLVSQSQYGVFEQFLNLPVFHQGGILGGGPRGAEMPYLGKVGEGVFTPDQMRAMAPGGETTVAVAIFADEDRALVDVNGQEFEVAVQRVHRKAISKGRRSFGGRRVLTP